jgi:hypothetical protein
MISISEEVVEQLEKSGLEVVGKPIDPLLLHDLDQCFGSGFLELLAACLFIIDFVFDGSVEIFVDDVAHDLAGVDILRVLSASEKLLIFELLVGLGFEEGLDFCEFVDGGVSLEVTDMRFFVLAEALFA